MDRWTKVLLFPLNAEEHGQMALQVCNSQCIVSASLKNKVVANSWARITVQSKVSQRQWLIKILLLIATSVQQTHLANLSPMRSGGHCTTEQRETATEFTVTTREHKVMLDHKRRSTEVAVLRLTVSGVIY